MKDGPDKGPGGGLAATPIAPERRPDLTGPTPNFAGVLFQDPAVAFLRGCLRHRRVHGCYLFAGPPACGKRRTALALAASVLCHDPATAGRGDPCQVCPACRRLATGSHPDLITIAPRGLEIRVDQIRALADEAQLRAYLGHGRIFLVDPADSLNESAANAFLKLLEEAPAGVVFVLLARARERMLPTIRSRSLTVVFAPPAPGPAREALVAMSGSDATTAARALALTDGQFGHALTLLRQLGPTADVRSDSPAAGAMANLPSDGNGPAPGLWATDETGEEVDDSDELILGDDLARPTRAPLPSEATPPVGPGQPAGPLAPPLPWTQDEPLASGLGPAQARYFAALAGLTADLARRCEQSDRLEPVLTLLADGGAELHRPGLLAARRETALRLLLAPALPAAFPSLFAAGLIDLIDRGKAATRKAGEKVLATHKASLAPAVAKEAGEHIAAAAGALATRQLEGFLTALSGLLADACRCRHGVDRSSRLNLDRDAAIMALAEMWSEAGLERGLRLVAHAQALLRRHVHPVLLLENLLMQLSRQP